MDKLLKRIGKQKEKFMFEICINWIKIQLQSPKVIFVIWQRSNHYIGNKYSSTDTKVLITPEMSMASFDDTVRMMNTLYMKKSGEILPKFAELKVVAQEEKKLKVLGKVRINLSIYYHHNSTDQIFPILKSSDKNAQLNFSIASTPLKHYTGKMPISLKDAPEIEDIKPSLNSSFTGQLTNSIIIESKDEDDIAEELYEEINRMRHAEDHLKHEITTLSHERDHYKLLYEDAFKRLQTLQSSDASGIQAQLEKARDKK